MININWGGAFAAEVILTFLFVLVVLAATSRVASAGFAGLAIGMGLALVHLIGIPITGTSVNPARSLGPALFVRGDALSMLWLFIVAPLVGGAIAAAVFRYLFAEPPHPVSEAPAGAVEATDMGTRASVDDRPATAGTAEDARLPADRSRVTERPAGSVGPTDITRDPPRA